MPCPGRAGQARSAQRRQHDSLDLGLVAVGGLAVLQDHEGDPLARIIGHPGRKSVDVAAVPDARRAIRRADQDAHPIIGAPPDLHRGRHRRLRGAPVGQPPGRRHALEAAGRDDAAGEQRRAPAQQITRGRSQPAGRTGHRRADPVGVLEQPAVKTPTTASSGNAFMRTVDVSPVLSAVPRDRTRRSTTLGRPPPPADRWAVRRARRAPTRGRDLPANHPVTR